MSDYLANSSSKSEYAGTKVLISTLSGHDKGEGRFYRKVLERLGCEVWYISTPSAGGDKDNGVYAEPGFVMGTTVHEILELFNGVPDLFLYIEPFGLIPRGIEEAPFPTACILCDTHRDLAVRLKLARFFDHVFLCHRNYVQYFSEHPGDYVHWQPYACDLELFRPSGIERDLDVAFIGMLNTDPARANILSFLTERYKVNEQRYYLQKEIPNVYSRAKIVLNLPLGDDLNFRTFEAMSCSAMLLTRRVLNGQEVLFQEGKQFEAFSDEKELFDKIEYYLSHPEERKSIAKAGYTEVVKKHGLDLRLKAILEEIEKKPDKVAPVRNMNKGELDRQYAWLYEYWRSTEAGVELVSEARKEGRPWLPLIVPAARSFLKKAFR